MRTADFDFELPSHLIAQTPEPARDDSRLLVLDRRDGSVSHRKFSDITEYLRPGDVLVLNNSRVIAARLRGVNARTAGAFELLLLEQNAVNDWWVMLRPGKRATVGTRIVMQNPSGAATAIEAKVVDINTEGHRRLNFTGTPDILTALDTLGEIPLPPYIRRDAATRTEQDRERYQTVFAVAPGSIAAPTAGLHFTTALLDRIRSLGVEVCFVTLHVGLATFAPVKSEAVEAHVMHDERYVIDDATAATVNAAKRANRRVIAVGTTSVRVLESAIGGSGAIKSGSGRTQIFIYPPFPFRIVNALVTNFHLPRSTLLMLASAFADPSGIGGRDRVLAAYAEAIRERYRFFSYGDAMLIV